MQWLTDRLVIDALHRDDAEALFRYRSDPEVSRYQGWQPGSIDDAVRFIETCAAIEPDTPGTWFQRAIRLRATGTLIGDVGLHFVADAEATVELGISLGLPYQRQGLASEALHAVLSAVFGELRKHRAFGSIDPRNHASAKLLAAAGMRKEADFHESLRIGNAWVDDVIYAMLAREWLVHQTAERHRG
jgi:RimJ/RimL family protein N-acetyltransferase